MVGTLITIIYFDNINNEFKGTIVMHILAINDILCDVFIRGVTLTHNTTFIVMVTIVGRWVQCLNDKDITL